MAEFCAMFSGSSGNCAYVSAGGASILIDAGVSARSICRALESIGSGIEKIAAILITHEHSDHIKGLKVLLSHHKIPVYASPGTIRGILEALPIDCENLNELETGKSVEIAGMCVRPFETSHDSKQSVGFRIHTPDDRKIGIATDLGFVSDEVLGGVGSCEVVMMESNHDVGMLQNGRYPYFLKRRIMSNTGHLSNDECSEVLPELCRGGTRHFVLAHLSRDNNIPELAKETAVAAMKMSGVGKDDYEIEIAPRSGPEHVLTI